MQTDPQGSPAAGSTPPAKRGSQRGLAVILTVFFGLLTLGTAYRVMLDVREARFALKDGGSANAYGFDLGSVSVGQEFITASNRPRDSFTAMCEPGHIDLAELSKINESQRGKYVLSGDRVIGVKVGEVACAYPLQVMNWHEVVNDTLDGVPIAVTYNGLADSSIVYDRRVEGKVLTFGVSGLVYNSNTVLYERQEPVNEVPAKVSGRESLWSQLAGECISGPGSGLKLQPIACEVLLWKDWLARYPQTLVLERDKEKIAEYKKDVYGPYFQSSKVEFNYNAANIDNSLAASGIEAKSLCLLAEADGGTFLIPHQPVLEAAQYGEDGIGTLTLLAAGRELTVYCRQREAGPSPESVWLELPGDDSLARPLATGFYFAFAALRPGFEVLLPAAPGPTP